MFSFCFPEGCRNQISLDSILSSRRFYQNWFLKLEKRLRKSRECNKHLDAEVHQEAMDRQEDANKNIHDAVDITLTKATITRNQNYQILIAIGVQTE